ncbi:MAG: polyprenyl synthetase family protein [Polyangiales bacterium]
MSNSWAEQVIARVNARLSSFFADKRELAVGLTPHAAELVDAVAELTMRGGKRTRALAIYAGYRAAAEQPTDAGFDAVVSLGAAVELLQSYLLIQDDWMDDDEERRGGPATHVSLTRHYGDPKLGASMAILAGDVAVGFAFELLHATHVPDRCAAAARAAFTKMHFEVVCGQQLDLLGHETVTLTHHLKTGSYTVRGPVTLGALAGDASDAQLHALEEFGRPLGIAFQLRDDILGTFGDTRTTGKPAGHDLREGKNTALVAAARKLLGSAERERLAQVFGRRDADDVSLRAVTELLERCGARAQVEAELRDQLDTARAALSDASLASAGVALLLELSDRIAVRDH